MEDQIRAIEKLIEKAAETDCSQEAMRFSQAACNAANALCGMKTAQRN